MSERVERSRIAEWIEDMLDEPLTVQARRNLMRLIDGVVDADLARVRAELTQADDVIDRLKRHLYEITGEPQ